MTTSALYTYNSIIFIITILLDSLPRVEARAHTPTPFAVFDNNYSFCQTNTHTHTHTGTPSYNNTMHTAVEGQ